MPIFRDRDELPTSSDLGVTLRNALNASRCLIVLCSAQSAKSMWVNEEVLAFKRLGRNDRIFCVILDGEPNASAKPPSGKEECFAPALRFYLNANGTLSQKRTEPIAADIRVDGWHNTVLKLIAGIVGLGFDELRQRDRQREIRKKIAWSAVAIVFAIFLIVIGTAYSSKSREVMDKDKVIKDEIIQKTLAQSDATAAQYIEKIVSAAKELEADHPAGVQPILKQCPQQLRNWEWYYLRAAADCAQSTMVNGKNGIHAMTSDLSGRYLAVGDDDGIIKLYDAGSLKLIHTIKLQQSDGITPPSFQETEDFKVPPFLRRQVSWLSLNSTATLLAAGDTQGYISLWNAKDGQHIRDIHQMDGKVGCLKFSLDASMLLAAGDQYIIGWDTSNWKTILNISLSDGGSISMGGTGISIGKDNRRIILAGGNTVRAWDALNGKTPKWKLGFGLNDSLTAFAESSDGLWICTGRSNGQLELRDAAKQLRTSPQNGHSQRINALAIDSKGKFVASAAGNIIKLWNFGIDEITDCIGLGGQSTLIGHQGDVTRLSFSHDGHKLFSADGAGEIRIWELKASQDKKLRLDGGFANNSSVVNSSSGMIASVDTFSGKGDMFGFESNTNERGVEVLVHDLKNGKKRWKLHGHKYSVEFLQFSRDGSRLMSFAFQDGVCIWDMNTGKRILTKNTGGASSVVMSNDGRYLAIDSGKIDLVNVDDGSILKTINIASSKSGLSYVEQFSQDDRLLIVSGDDCILRIVDPDSGKELHQIEGFKNRPQKVSISPNSKILATAGLTEKVTSLWDVASGKRLAQLVGHEGSINSLAFSEDSRRILTGSGDGTIRVWDTDSGKSLVTLRIRREQAESITKSHVDLVGWLDKSLTVLAVCDGEIILYPTK
jgi:WD40 repeat protein